MENARSKKLVLLAGTVGIILTLLSSVLAVVGGCAILFVYFYVYGAGVLMILSGVVLFAAFIVGIAAVAAKNVKLTFVSAIMSILSSTVITCCMGVPFQSVKIYIMLSMTAVLSFAAFVLFMLYYVGTSAAVPKKNKRLLFIIPIAVMCTAFVIAIPSAYFGVCNYAYSGLLNQMSDMKYGRFCVHYSSFGVYNALLPDSYKDVAAIRKEMEDYNYLECLHALDSDYNDSYELCGARARVAYLRLMEMQKADSRWGFKELTRMSETLLSGASWQGGGEKFQFKYDAEAGGYTVNTDLPFIMTESENGENAVYVLRGTEAMYFYLKNNKAPSYRISEFTYDAEKCEFSIEVYCFKTDRTYTMTYAEQYEWIDFDW